MGHLKLNWKNIGLAVSWILLPIGVWYAAVGQHKLTWILLIIWCIYRHGDLLWKEKDGN